MRTIVLSIFALSRALSGQPPAFDVASVKPAQHPIDAGGGSHSFVNTPSPGTLRAENASIQELIEFAYDVKDYQISGAHWMETFSGTGYDIDAKAAPGTAKKQMRLMLQALLAERFKLAVHRETKILPQFHLVVAKGGPKLREAGPDSPHGWTYRGGSTTFQGISMPILTEHLALEMHQIVVDKTELKGQYDFTLQYVREEGASLDGPNAPSLFAAVQEQLGLKLVSTKGPVEIIVVDHAEKIPTGN
jgi:uncharacterized protein (TIGR03435 family)